MDRKRSWALAVGATLAIAVLAACSQSEPAATPEEQARIMAPDPAVMQSESAIGDEGAREIALAHAGYKAEDVTIVHEGRLTEYNELAHEVEFYTGTREYDYTVNASTGEIMAFDEDAEHYAIADWYRDTPPSTDSPAFIGDQRAKEIALSDAGIAEQDTTNMRIALDYDEREPRYEVEFDTPDKQYQYEIYASSGAIMSFDTPQA